MPRQKRKTTKKATTRRAPAKKKATKKKTAKKKTATRRAPTKKKTAKKKATKKKTATRRAPTKKKTAKKKTVKKKTTKKKATKKKTATRRAPTKNKTVKKKATKKKATKKKATKKKTVKKKTSTRRAPTKKKTTKKKTSTRRAPTKKKAAKKKVTRRRSTTRSSPAKKARSRRTTTKKSTPRRAPAKRASSRRKSPAVYRGESGLRRFLSDLDAAIVKTDKWIATVNTQAANIAGGFDVQLHELAGLAAALESDQATIDALREDLDAIQVVTPAIKTLQQRLAGTSGTVMGIREELQRIAEIKAPGLLRIGGHGHLVGKAGCTMAASRHGTPPEHCGPGTMTPQMASQVLVAAREGDIPALCRWVVEAQVPLVSGGSIPPSDADVDAFRQGKTARPPRSSVRRARPPLARPKTPEPVPPALVTPPARAASPKPRTKSSSVDTGGPTPAQQQLELTVRKGLGV